MNRFLLQKFIPYKKLSSLLTKIRISSFHNFFYCALLQNIANILFYYGITEKKIPNFVKIKKYTEYKKYDSPLLFILLFQLSNRRHFSRR